MTKCVSFKNKNSSFFLSLTFTKTDRCFKNELSSFFLSLSSSTVNVRRPRVNPLLLLLGSCRAFPATLPCLPPNLIESIMISFPFFQRPVLSLALLTLPFTLFNHSLFLFRPTSDHLSMAGGTRDLSLSLLLFLVFSFGKRILSVVGWRRKWGKGMESKLSKTVFSSQIHCSKLELLGRKQHGSWDSKLELGSESEPRHLLVQRTSSHHHPSSRLPKTFPFNLFSLNSFFSSSLFQRTFLRRSRRVCLARVGHGFRGRGSILERETERENQKEE